RVPARGGQPARRGRGAGGFRHADARAGGRRMKPFADLARFINPVNVVVVGASPRPASQGGRLYANLVRHSRLPGQVYAVNPAYNEIDGAPCWPSIRELPDAPIDV